MATTWPERTTGTVAAGGTEQDLALCIRELETAADRAACVRLQGLVWGEGYRDRVPGSLIKASREVGGLCAGAFTEAGELIGFVYGLTGVRSGRLAHWSHMLGVVPAYRDRGVGRRLKMFQRDAVRAAGVGVMYWTFDPLVARNAHLNLNRLGVVIEGYIEDMYPDTGSDLHAFGTDRLVVSWPVTGEAVAAGSAAGDGSSIPVWRGGLPPGDPPAVRVAIPSDAESMRASELEALREWRRSTRSAFTTLFDAGWTVAGFSSDGDMGHYVLTRPG